MTKRPAAHEHEEEVRKDLEGQVLDLQLFAAAAAAAVLLFHKMKKRMLLLLVARALMAE